MARALKARKPDEGLAMKPKVLIFGPPGVGKTTVLLEFPKLYLIDTEDGASGAQYQRRLKQSGGAYFGRDEGSNDFATVIQEVQTLATVPHDYLTLGIDSFSKLYNIASAQAEARVGNDFGKDRKEANKPTRQLMLWLQRLDMNVVLVCHQREKWGRQGGNLVNEGQTFDGYDKLEYDLDLALHVTKAGARVHKSRIEGFPRDATFPWSFAEFEKRAGQGVMLRPPRQVEVATPESVAEVRHLLGVVRVPEDWPEQVLSKAGVERWEDMDAEKMAKCLSHLRGLIKPEGQK